MTTGIGTAALLAGAAISAAGAIRQGQATAAAARFNSQIARQQAAQERAAAQHQAADVRRQGSRQRATMRALSAGSGITSFGTPLLLAAAQTGEVELGARTIEVGGATRALRKEQEATLLNARARSARAAGFIRAGSTLLTAFSSVNFGGAPQQNFPTVPATQTGPSGFLAGPV